MPAKKQNPQPEAAPEPSKNGDSDSALNTDGSLSNLGRIMPRPIVAEMEESYLSYAMSVIVARALPDARDGLKPVHRRILYAMHGMGLGPAAKYRKSAAVVGDVMGKYHPHGDSPIYEAMVRMAQDFSLRYALVDGQGNFGSIDGDGAAAMRYTEARMAKITGEILADIEKDTVDFVPNYDASRKEPAVLPSKIPNLLLNGSVGIAVGMATNIPPHNFGEIIDAALHVIEHSDASVEDLLPFVQGPDFPTGGIVYDKEAIRQAYLTGRGSVVIRGKAEIEEINPSSSSGRYHIRISEIPFQVNKSAMIEKMAQLVNDKLIQGISDIRDESDRDGIRIIIELKKDAYPQKVLNQLFKHTDLQTSFGYNMIALADGIQPRLLNLQEFLQIFVDHRRTVVRRRITFDRDRAKDRAHILEGLKKALDHIDEVIKVIKRSETKEMAKENLVEKFELTVIQADAILQMRLQTLAGLERKKIDDELRQKKEFIAECESLLASQKKMDGQIMGELVSLKASYTDGRRTAIVPHAVGEFSAKDTIPNAPMIVTLTRAGYVKRLSPMQFRAQNRGGKGIIGMTTKDDDEVLSMVHVMNHDDMLFFTNTGRVFKLPTYEVPQAGRVAKGQAIVNLLQLQPEERITAILKADLKDKKHLFMTTMKGTVKRTDLTEFENIRRSGLIAQKLPPGDDLKWVIATSGKDEVYILTKQGKSIRFKEDEVRSMGRAAAGVRGIHLAPGDDVVEAAVITDPDKSKLLVVMENGLGKMTSVGEYRLQGRGGTGVKVAQLTSKTGNIVGGHVLTDGEDGDLLCISKQGQMIRMRLSDIPSRGRATQGVIVMRLGGGDKVATMSVILENKESQEAIAQAAIEERAEEVEAIVDDTKAVKRAERRAAKQTVESLMTAGVSIEQAKVAVMEKPRIQAPALKTTKATKVVQATKAAKTRTKVLAKSPAKAHPKPSNVKAKAGKMAKMKPKLKMWKKKRR